MIDDELPCLSNPVWLEDFKRKLREDYRVSHVEALCISSEVCKRIREERGRIYNALVKLGISGEEIKNIIYE